MDGGMLGVFLLPAFIHLGHECQDLWSAWDGMHMCTDWTSVYTLIRKSFGGMESEPMLTPREKSPLLEKISSEEDGTHDAAASRTTSATHYQRAILAQFRGNDLCFNDWVELQHRVVFKWRLKKKPKQMQQRVLLIFLHTPFSFF